MDVGRLVLYVLFALVALWLLTEALWQHGAPFRYRVLALFGFLGVVAGVVAGNLVAIGAGVFCFAVGQFLTTRHLRRGYHHGWTVGRRRPRLNRHGRARMRPGGPGPEAAGPETPAEPAVPAPYEPADAWGAGATTAAPFPAAPWPGETTPPGAPWPGGTTPPGGLAGTPGPGPAEAGGTWAGPFPQVASGAAAWPDDATAAFPEPGGTRPVAPPPPPPAPPPYAPPGAGPAV